MGAGSAPAPLPVVLPPPLLQLWVLWQPEALALAEATAVVPTRGRLTTTATATKRSERRRILMTHPLSLSMGTSHADPQPSWPTTERVNIITVDELIRDGSWDMLSELALWLLVCPVCIDEERHVPAGCPGGFWGAGDRWAGRSVSGGPLGLPRGASLRLQTPLRHVLLYAGSERSEEHT